jgi:uncharacterized radical SAM superfamily protein
MRMTSRKAVCVAIGCVRPRDIARYDLDLHLLMDNMDTFCAPNPFYFVGYVLAKYRAHT